jgi:competence protein ComGA
MQKYNGMTQLLQDCINERVADLYILPNEQRYVLSYQSAVGLGAKIKLDQAAGKQLIAQLKYRANMAVSEHRRPQVGALREGVVNLRLSTVGDFQGHESLVVRFIYPLQTVQNQILIAEQQAQLENLIQQRGLILFAGPTGSGKTTTMYQLIKKCCAHQMIMTIEDPVEIEEPNFLQLQVNENAQMSYEQLIKVGLRHRPEVFIIGEIRDPQTAQMAIRAALSGHLVLSTIHAQSAQEVLTRLEQLEVEPYYLEQVIQGVCYQRLLPTTNDKLAVLYDILDKNCLFENRSDNSQLNWRMNLERCVKEEKITAKTAKKYSNG